MATTTTPFLGCKISLISKSEIRYEGILYTIDPKESTIALAKVRFFGTEDRPAERHVPPINTIFDCIVFRNEDIKDVFVGELTASVLPGVPTVRIFVQKHSTSPSTTSSKMITTPNISSTCGHWTSNPSLVLGLTTLGDYILSTQTTDGINSHSLNYTLNGSKRRRLWADPIVSHSLLSAISVIQRQSLTQPSAPMKRQINKNSSGIPETEDNNHTSVAVKRQCVSSNANKGLGQQSGSNPQKQTKCQPKRKPFNRFAGSGGYKR